MDNRSNPTVIMADRGTGKSTALLRLALKEHGNIAVFNRESCDVFATLAAGVLKISEDRIQRVGAYGWVMIEDVLVAPIGAYMQRPSGNYMNPARPLFIDELEPCLRGVFYRYPRIGGFTMSI